MSVDTVGTSWRTDGKHDYLIHLVRKEQEVVNVMSRRGEHHPCVWYDLCAGDGSARDGRRWVTSCSPGILADFARRLLVPARVLLYEINPATYAKLLGNLAEHLPGLGYRRTATNAWRVGNVELWVINADGLDADLNQVIPGAAVFALNDPNLINDWAMKPTFAQEVIARGARFFRSMSTLGCNVAGNKRLAAEKREGWFDLVQHQQDALPAYRDLLLTAIRGDSDQWAYLVGEAVKWRSHTQRAAIESFANLGREVDNRWASDRSGFEELKQRLFWTAKEVRHREPGLFGVVDEPAEPPPYRTYREYLRHPRFLKVRAEVFERAAGKCERCGQRPPTEPHHLRYPPWGEFDVKENMIAVCHPCHCEIHGKPS